MVINRSSIKPNGFDRLGKTRENAGEPVRSLEQCRLWQAIQPMVSREQPSQSPNCSLLPTLSNEREVYLLTEQSNTPVPLSENQKSESLKGTHSLPSTDAVGFLDTADPVHFLGGSPVTNLQRHATSGTHNDTVSDYMERYRSTSTENMKSAFTAAIAPFLNAPQAQRKLQGSLGIGGTFHCKIVWNSDPMLRGLGLLAYLPPGVDDYVQSNSVTGVDANGIYLSGCPKVFVNLALDSSVELSVPYVGETVFAPARVDTGVRQLGTFKYYPLVAPTGPAGIVDVTCHVYMKMSDVVTFGNFASVPFYQMETVANYQMEAALEAIKKSKIVSKGTGSIASWLNGNTDDTTFGDISRAGGWIVGGVSKIADLLGWSKPLNIVNPQPVVHMNNIDMITSDSTFTGMKYAQNIDAGVSRISLSDNGKDQLEICNFMRENEIIPYQFTFSKDNTIGTILRKIDMNPRSWIATYSDKISMNHMTFLSHLFGYWRGAIDVTIHPVMTKFHSGRIRVIFSPANPVADADILDNMSYTYTWIIDLSDPSTWTIRVPYVAITPWRETGSPDGQLYFVAETELHASAGVSTGIDVFLSVSPTSELEFAGPRSINSTGKILYPDVLYTPPKSATFQMEAIKFVDSTSPSTGAHQLAIGDPVRSLRTVMKRFWPAVNVPANNTKALKLTVESVRANKGPNPTALDRDLDMISLIGLCFVFHRGGMRYGSNGRGIKSAHFRLGTTSFSRNGSELDPSEPLNRCEQTFQFGLEEAVKFELPYYSTYLATNVWNYRTNETSRGTDLPACYLTFANNVPTVVSRALADDYDMGFLIGVPPFRSLDRPTTAAPAAATTPPPTKVE